MIINPIPEYSIIRKLDEEKKQKEEERPKLYTIKQGNYLEKIAQEHGTTVDRLAAKNNIANPNHIDVGQTLTIPTADEVLQIPEKPVETAVNASERVTPKTTPVASSAGNTYSYGYCTWYVKNMRPDLPNSLGNADSWYIRYNGPKGSEPKVGAVGVAQVGYMHVVYITAVNGDGTVTLSEMNYQGWNVVSTRTAPATDFLYLY